MEFAKRRKIAAVMRHCYTPKAVNAEEIRAFTMGVAKNTNECTQLSDHMFNGLNSLGYFGCNVSAHDE